MNVTVLGFSQEMSFEDGALTNFVKLGLPTGTVISVVVSDLGLRHLLAAREGVVFEESAPAPPPPSPQSPAPAPAVAHPQRPAQQPAYDHTFGGDYEGAEESVADYETPPPYNAPAQQSFQAWRPDGPQVTVVDNNAFKPREGRQVMADESGNPIVEDTGVDVEAILEGGLDDSMGGL